MTATSLVSVVIPVYNGARFLSDAIESVLEQTYPALEVVVVDDGSTDESCNIVQAYSERIVAVRQTNSGVARARNAGVRASRGEFVALLDQDDWWHEDKVKKQVAMLEADQELALVHTNVAHYDQPTGSFVGRLNPRDAPERLSGRCYERLLLGNHIYNSTVMVRRSALDMVGDFDITIAGNTVADYDLWLRLARHFKFAFIPEELAVFRIHDGQGTWRRREMLAAELQLVERTVGKLAWRASRVLTARIALLREELGVAHLDAHDVRSAHRCFRQALREQPSVRRMSLYAASLLPSRFLHELRSLRRKLQRRAPAQGPVALSPSAPRAGSAVPQLSAERQPAAHSKI